MPPPMPASSITWSAWPGSQRSMRWMSVPIFTWPSTPPIMPVAWVTGEPMSFGSPGVIQSAMWRSSLRIVRWSWITPLGSLVVPEV